jgi:hypothetical protein
MSDHDDHENLSVSSVDTAAWRSIVGQNYLNPRQLEISSKTQDE